LALRSDQRSRTLSNSLACRIPWLAIDQPRTAHKEHITDWIGAHTSLGEALKSYDLERLASQVTGDYVTVAYRIHTNWVGNDGVDKPTTTRIVHSWLRSAGGKWQIISGMAAPANAHGH
jgi:ketosteroid isomerase-like protein